MKLAIVAFLTGVGLAGCALAQGAPTTIEAMPVDAHVGENSVVFRVIDPMTRRNVYYGVTIDHTVMGTLIVDAATDHSLLNFGLPAGGSPTVPCDPNYCAGSQFATRVTNFVVPPIPFGGPN